VCVCVCVCTYIHAYICHGGVSRGEQRAGALVLLSVCIDVKTDLL